MLRRIRLDDPVDPRRRFTRSGLRHGPGLHRGMTNQMPNEPDQVTTRTTLIMEVGRGRKRQRLDLTTNPEPRVSVDTLRRLGVKIVERQAGVDGRVVSYDFGYGAGHR